MAEVFPIDPEQICVRKQRPASSGVVGEWPEHLHSDVVDQLASAGITRPWSHQAQAIDSILTGHHTVIATGTGSGKSLCAWAPVASAMASHEKVTSLADLRKKPTALYMAPTKALAADQYVALTRLFGEMAADAAVVDGDAPTEVRRWARQHGRIVLTNPDFAHFSLLAGHQHWSRFWAGLTHIIIDEFHTYRGTTGSNVALVVRRMLRVARHYGATPTVVFLSATASAPGQATEAFINEAVAVVDEDGSAQPAFETIIARPALIDSDPNERRRSVTKEAAKLAAISVAAGKRTLVFARSRAGTEALASTIAEDVPRHLVSAYRGGYLPEERRELEEGLRTGQLMCLASTNALELGIDISGLDTVILAGWPGTHASFRQQLGRAGRHSHDGLGILITRDDPLDEYYAAHPDILFSAPVESQVFDPSNPYVLHGHVCAAAAEVPLTRADADVFGLADTSLFEDLAEAGLLISRGDSWRWNVALGTSAHELVDIRGTAQEISIIDQTTGILLGTVPGERADAAVHPGAIYVHRGALYSVTGLDGERALVEPHLDEEIRTYARSESAVDIITTHSERPLGDGILAYGDVRVTSRVTGFDTRRASDGLYLGRTPLEMPVRTLDTSGCWFTLSEKTCAAYDLTPDLLPGALHGLEHTAIGLLPLFATCDRWDLGGLSTALHPQTGLPTIIIHDASDGGSGCVERGYQQFETWMRAVVDRLKTCQCREGCPSCIQSPKCGNGNHPLSKVGALLVGTAVLDALT